MGFPRQISIRRSQISRTYSFTPTFSWAESVSRTTTGVILILSTEYYDVSYDGRYQFQGETRSETCPPAKIEGRSSPEIRNLRILIVNTMSPTALLPPVRPSGLIMIGDDELEGLLKALNGSSVGP